MRILVQKYGGTSVNTPESRARAAAKIIQARESGYSMVVVVSAIGRRGAPYATDTLGDMLKGIDPTVAPNPREWDMLLACGEIISTVVMAHTLKTMGYDAVALTGGQAGIYTDNEFTNARILRIEAQPIRHYLEQGLIVVVAGFQGSTEPTGPAHPDITTLGRGGSDTTASALGVALQAEAVEIYTDVDGVLTADPDAVRAARTLSVISYEEVAEIAHQGAKVLHPRAAEIAMAHNIPLWVKNTFSDEPGTMVTSRESAGDGLPEVTGVTHTSGRIAFLEFCVGDLPTKADVERRIYHLMAQARTSLHLNSTAADTFSFAIPRDRFTNIRGLLDGLVMPAGGGSNEMLIFQLGDEPSLAFQAQYDLLMGQSDRVPVRVVPVNVRENCTLVSVIGPELMKRPGMFAFFLLTLYDAGINVVQTANSSLSLSAVVNDSDCDRAVRVLHARFVEERAYALG